MSRRSSSRDFDDDDPSSLDATLAGVSERLGNLARQCARLARGDIDRDGPAGIRDALATFNQRFDAHIFRRLEQIAGPKTASRPDGVVSDGKPATAAPAQPSPPLTSPIRGTAAAERAQLLNELELQLRDITQQVSALHQRGRIDEAIGSLHHDLAAIGRGLQDSIPRATIDALAKDVRILSERAERGRDSTAQDARLAALEQGIVQTRDALHSFTDLKKTVGGIAQQIDRVSASSTGANNTLARLAEDILALSNRVEQKLADGHATVQSDFDRQTAALIEDGRSTTAAALTSVVEQLDRKVAALADTQRAELVQLVASMEDRLGQRFAALTESSRIEGAQVARTLVEQFDERIASIANDVRQKSAETSRILTSEFERVSSVLDSGRKESTDAIKALAGGLEQRITALSEGRNDAMRAIKVLGEQIYSHISTLSETSLAKSAETEASVKALSEQIDQRLAALAGGVGKPAENEASLKSLGDRLEQQLAALTEAARAESAKMGSALSTQIDAKFTALADGPAQAAQTLKAFGEQFDWRITALSQENRAEIAEALKALRDETRRHFATLGDGGRVETTEAIKALGERLDRRLSASTDTNSTGLVEAMKALGETTGHHMASLMDQGLAQAAADHEKLLDAAGRELQGRIAELLETHRSHTTEAVAKVLTEQVQAGPATEPPRPEGPDPEALAQKVADALESRMVAPVAAAGEPVDVSRMIEKLGEKLQARIESLLNRPGETESLKSTLADIGGKIERQITMLADADRPPTVDPERMVDAIAEKLEGRMTSALQHERPLPADSDALASRLSDLDRRISALFQGASNERADPEALTTAINEQIHSGIETLAQSYRSEMADAETLVKNFTQDFDHRFASLLSNSQTVMAELAAQIGALKEQIDALQAAKESDKQSNVGGQVALAGIEERITKLAAKLDTADARLARLAAIERGIAYVLSRLEERPRPGKVYADTLTRTAHDAPDPAPSPENL